MATYVASPPPGALECASGDLIVIAPDQTAAMRAARDGSSSYIHGQVEGAAQTALWRITSLQKEIAKLQKPHTYYTLGDAILLYDEYWRFPMKVFISESGAG